MMGLDVKSKQYSRTPSSSRTLNPSALGPSSVPSASGNPSNNGTGINVGGSHQKHHPHSHHHLNLLDGPPTLHRRISGSTTASSAASENIPGHNTAGTSTNTNANTLPVRKASKKTKNPLRVLGIALIVDQKGTGARMLARYPTSQASVKKDEEDDDNQENGLLFEPNHNGYDDHDHEDEIDDDDVNGDDRLRRRSGDDDLFFTLTGRQMAKLFRTKRSLCNQPMTLRVNKTIFCCHAVLLEEINHNTHHHSSGNSIDKDNNPTAKAVSSSASSSVSSVVSDVKGVDNDDDDDKKDNSLRLFSVVVALAPSTQQSAMPFSSIWDFSGFGGGENRSDLERYIRHGGIPSSKSDGSGNAFNSNKSTVQKKGEGKTLKGDSSGINTSHISKDHRIGDKKGDKRSKLKQEKQPKTARVSSLFLAIRRVHISLIRFCRALEREEHRCGYVTQQSRALFETRNERQKQWDLMRNDSRRQSLASTMTSTNNSNNLGGSGDRSPTTRVGGVHHHAPRHSRQNSFLSTPGGGNTLLSDTTLKKAFDNNDLGGNALGLIDQEQEKEQEILELMLACNPQDRPQGQQQQQHTYQKQQHGNLVRDLVAVFHSLSRNDHEYTPTPSSLLCERDAVVYVNQHFAIPVDAAGLNGHSQLSSFAPGAPSSRQHKIGSMPIAECGLPVVRPYYTLLFPHASPSELLQTFHASGSAPPQQMEHLLLTVNPQKPLTQIAADANLPMHTTIQIASFLIARGACTTSPVVSSRSRLTCFGSDSMRRISELALDFSQAFPGVSLFGVVSFLTTSSRHLGDAMAVLVDTENEEGAWLRESLLSSSKYRYYNRSRGVGDGDKVGFNETATVDTGIAKSTHQEFFPDEKNDSSFSPTIHPSYISIPRGGGPKPLGMAQEPTPMSVHEWLKDLEDMLFAIAVWLLSHRVLVQLQEYMVVVAEITSPCLMAMSANSDNESTPSLLVPPFASSAAAVTSNTAVKNNSNDWDENLLKELMEMEHLNGDISIMALSWRMAMDPRKLRQWGLRHKRVRVISRVPSPGDDWEPATAMTPSPLSPSEPPQSSSSPAAVATATTKAPS